MRLIKLVMFASSLCLIIFSLPLDSVAAENDNWEFLVSPYAWLTSIDGDVSIKNQKEDIDIGIDDIVNNLDFSGMLYMEAKKGKFGFYLEANYLKVGDDEDLGLHDEIEFDFEQESWIVEFGCSYRLGQWNPERPVTLEVLLGGRYYNISTELDYKNKFTGIKHGKDSDVDLLDPTVGLRLSSYLSEHLRFNLRADMGGFDISDSTTKSSWQVMGLLGYDLSQKTTIFAGYRAIDIDCEKDDFKMDMTFHGPVLGAVFKFGEN